MAEFEPDHRGLGQVLFDPFLLPPLRRQAQAIMARAKTIAMSHYSTGDYEGDFSLEEGRHRSRMYVRVVNDNDVANLLEGRYHILGRAIG